MARLTADRRTWLQCKRGQAAAGETAVGSGVCQKWSVRVSADQGFGPSKKKIATSVSREGKGRAAVLWLLTKRLRMDFRSGDEKGSREASQGTPVGSFWLRFGGPERAEQVTKNALFS